MVSQIVQLVWRQFNERRLRSLLTVLGICIGIAALVALILLSTALKSGITRQLDRFDTDIILVAPRAGVSGAGGPSGFGVFTNDDAQVVEQIPQIERVWPLLRSTFEITYGREKLSSDVRAIPIDEEFEDFINQDLFEGRYLTSSDYKSVNIGYRMAKERFDKEIFVGNTIEIQGDKYTVVGIFVEEGDSSTDNIIVTNLDALRNTVGDSKAVTALNAKVSPGADIVLMEERIQRTLERYRGADDFVTTTPQAIVNDVNGLLGTVDIVVLSVALVSLFVASLGVTNSLFTSVYQRTKEIGTMKAIGARNSQILSVFLIESSLLGFVGGVVGTLIGMGLAFSFIGAINTFGFIRLEMGLDIGLFVGAILFSTVLGIIAGSLPAYRASQLKPVDALRFE